MSLSIPKLYSKLTKLITKSDLFIKENIKEDLISLRNNLRLFINLETINSNISGKEHYVNLIKITNRDFNQELKIQLLNNLQKIYNSLVKDIEFLKGFIKEIDDLVLKNNINIGDLLSRLEINADNKLKTSENDVICKIIELNEYMNNRYSKIIKDVESIIIDNNKNKNNNEIRKLPNIFNIIFDLDNSNSNKDIIKDKVNELINNI